MWSVPSTNIVHCDHFVTNVRRNEDTSSHLEFSPGKTTMKN